MIFNGWNAQRTDQGVVLEHSDGLTATVYIDNEATVHSIQINGGRITAAHLRTIPIGAITDWAKPQQDLNEPDDSLPGIAAAQYLALLKVNPAATGVDLARAMGKPISTTQRWLSQARRRGMIKRATIGRPLQPSSNSPVLLN